MARSGMRSWVRQAVACEPGGCGAQPGQPCTAYVPKRGKTTGKPTADVHAARYRAFRAGQRKRITEREEKVMGTSDELPAEEAWAATPEGQAAVTAASERVMHMGFDAAVPSYVITAACHAALMAGGGSQQEPDGTGHEHRWQPLGAQQHDPAPPDRPHVHTAALLRCPECMLLCAVMLPGMWTLADLTRDGDWP